MAANRKTWVAITVAFLCSAEGIRQVAYQDVNGVWTDCVGETRGVRKGDVSTLEQCMAKLGARVLEFGAEVDACCPACSATPERKAAATSFFYNVGSATACRSSVVRKLNAGDVQGGCDALLLYNKAGGVVFPGLTKRRERERELCLS